MDLVEVEGDSNLLWMLLLHWHMLCCRKKTRRSYGFGEGSSEYLEAPQAQVSEGLSSSVFDILSPANIPADKSGHKVREGRGGEGRGGEGGGEGRGGEGREVSLYLYCRSTWPLSV